MTTATTAIRTSNASFFRVHVHVHGCLDFPGDAGVDGGGHSEAVHGIWTFFSSGVEGIAVLGWSMLSMAIVLSVSSVIFFPSPEDK